MLKHRCSLKFLIRYYITVSPSILYDRTSVLCARPSRRIQSLNFRMISDTARQLKNYNSVAFLAPSADRPINQLVPTRWLTCPSSRDLLSHDPSLYHSAPEYTRHSIPAENNPLISKNCREISYYITPCVRDTKMTAAAIRLHATFIIYYVFAANDPR